MYKNIQHQVSERTDKASFDPQGLMRRQHGAVPTNGR